MFALSVASYPRGSAMAWTRLDDSFYDHPKAARTSLAAIGLWTKALSYCARHLTDGFVPKLIVIELAHLPPEPALNLAKELVRARLWKAVGTKGFKFHDYLEYNPSAKILKSQRVKSTARHRRWVRKKSAERSSYQTSEPKSPANRANGVSNGVTNASTNASTNTCTNACSNAAPTPTPIPVVLGIRSSVRGDGDHPHSEFAHASGNRNRTDTEADHAQKKAQALAQYRAAMSRLFPTA
jgi:hypothetical protein